MPFAKIQFVLALISGLLLTQTAPQMQTPPEKAAPNANAPRYNVTVIAPFPYISDDIAVGLNDAGQAAVWQKTADDLIRAARWPRPKLRDKFRPGTRDELTAWMPPPNFLNAIPRAINRRGQAAGWGSDSRNLVDSRANVHALFFDSGKARDLGTLGGKNSQAFGLNEGGQVVGTAQTVSGDKHAFVWNRGKMRDLGALPNGKYSAAYGINKAGDIVGVSAFDALNNHAVLWRRGKIFDLGVLPNGSGSFARAINDRGQIVGFGRIEDDTHAFFYENGKMNDLGTLGKDPSNANSINSAGVIVGASAIKGGRRHACVWRDGKPLDLNLLITPGIWTLREAYTVNASGQVVCLGANRAGALFSVLLTPAAPPPN